MPENIFQLPRSPLAQPGDAVVTPESLGRSASVDPAALQLEERFFTPGTSLEVTPIPLSQNPGFFDLVEAHVRYNTPVGAAIAGLGGTFDEDETFNPADIIDPKFIEDLQVDARNLRALYDAKSIEEFDFIVDRLIQEQADRNTIGEFGFVPNFLAGLASAPL